MADNVAITAGSGTTIGTVDVGAGRQVQIFTQGAQAATVSNVSASATSVTILSATDTRAGASILNDTSDTTNYLYVKMGTTASTTDYSVMAFGWQRRVRRASLSTRTERG
jgi:hypothetical protein